MHRERTLNTGTRSSDPTFAWMVEWSAGLITRYVTGSTGRTAYRGARDHDAQAPVADFGEKIMCMMSEKTSNSARAHIREHCATEGCPGFMGIETGRSLPHNNECRNWIRTSMEQDEDGREGSKKKQQRHDRHLEKAVARTVEEDHPALRRPRRSTSENLWRLRTMVVQEEVRQKKK